jgi:hypothetical protein
VRAAPRAALLLASALVACAAGGDAPVSHDAAGAASGAQEPQPVLVTPRGGLEELQPYPFEEATPIGDGRTLRVRFWGGVAPCFLLGAAEVVETREAVTVTLFTGSDPAQADAVCIEIAVLMATDVRLAAPLGGRRVRDGAAELEGG